MMENEFENHFVALTASRHFRLATASDHYLQLCVLIHPGWIRDFVADAPDDVLKQRIGQSY
jgi:hypothetical protein